jgi:hypothetical protein
MDIKMVDRRELGWFGHQIGKDSNKKRMQVGGGIS